MMGYLEQRLRFEVGAATEVSVGKRRDLASARGALDEALLDEERLVDLLDGSGILA